MRTIDGLEKVSLFSRLSDDVLEEVATSMVRRAFQPGDVLFNLGDAGDELFIIQSGRVAIYMPNAERPEEERPIRIFGPGEALGEMALIDAQPRSASARALEAGAVLVLTGEKFRRLLREHPDLALSVMAELNERVRYTTEFLYEVRGWVKRVAEGKYERRFRPSKDYGDQSVAALAADFAQMAAQVQQREEELRREVQQLRIQINQTKRERHVEEITESDYFQSLQAKARELRNRE